MNPTAVYTYCRVSTKQQDIRGMSLAEQKDRCARFAHEKGWVVTEVVEEVGSAFSKLLKKQAALLECAVPGSLILVVSYDRFSRNVIHGAMAIQELAKRKIRVFSIQEQQDSLTPVGRYTFAITVAAGEFASGNTGAKVAATFAKQKSEGIEHGPARYGQKVIKEVDEAGRLRKRKRVVDDKEETVIELMQGLVDGITAKRATTLMNKVIPREERAPVEFLDANNQVVPRVEPGALNYEDIANLLEEYNVPYRNGKHWTKQAVSHILRSNEVRAAPSEVDDLGAVLDGVKVAE